LGAISAIRVFSSFRTSAFVSGFLGSKWSADFVCPYPFTSSAMVASVVPLKGK
jgi:hypothetical protein